MRALRKVAVFLVFGLFVSTLLLRPLTRLLTAGFSEDGFDASALVLGAPGLVLAVVTLVVAVSILSGRDGQGAEFGEVLATRDHTETGVESGSQDNPDAETSAVDAQQRGGDGDTNGTTRTRFHTGQGGTRNRGFEIEDEPPEADVDEHLRYLRTQLGDTEFDAGSQRGSRESDGNAVEHGIDRRDVPARCPHSHCDARWSDRGLFGIRGGRYEVVADGQVRCENCGAITDCS